VSKNNILFRLWFYFRSGWSMYFAFIIAAINTLTVTYFLAVDNYPTLKIIFPSFEYYVFIIAAVGIPLLVFIGYSHFRKTQGFRAEADVWVESNPYYRRMVVNTEIILQLTLKLIDKQIKISNNEKLSLEEINEIKKIQDEIKEFTEKRTFDSKEDVDYFKNLKKKHSE